MFFLGSLSINAKSGAFIFYI